MRDRRPGVWRVKDQSGLTLWISVVCWKGKDNIHILENLVKH
jgi:hypothetical protein